MKPVKIKNCVKLHLFVLKQTIRAAQQEVSSRGLQGWLPQRLTGVSLSSHSATVLMCVRYYHIVSNLVDKNTGQ